MKLLVVATFLFATVYAGTVPDRIVGGHPTTIESYPGIVQVEYYVVGWTQACGANILTSRWLVTAAHCFGSGTSSQTRRLRAGTTERGVGGLVRYLSRWIRHPNHELVGNRDNDIALIQAEVALTYSETIQPVSILSQGAEVPDNALVTHVGWGYIQSGGPYPEDNGLHEVDIYTINREECRRRYVEHPEQWLYNFEVSENMICVGILDVGGKDSCQGDSGGPLYYSGILVGIVSWGIGCGDAYYPGVNARVAAYTDWIIQTAV